MKGRVRYTFQQLSALTDRLSTQLRIVKKDLEEGRSYSKVLEAKSKRLEIEKRKLEADVRKHRELMGDRSMRRRPRSAGAVPSSCGSFPSQAPAHAPIPGESEAVQTLQDHRSHNRVRRPVSAHPVLQSSVECGMANQSATHEVAAGQSDIMHTRRERRRQSRAGRPTSAHPVLQAPCTGEPADQSPVKVPDAGQSAVRRTRQGHQVQIRDRRPVSAHPVMQASRGRESAIQSAEHGVAAEQSGAPYTPRGQRMQGASRRPTSAHPVMQVSSASEPAHPGPAGGTGGACQDRGQTLNANLRLLQNGSLERESICAAGNRIVFPPGWYSGPQGTHWRQRGDGGAAARVQGPHGRRPLSATVRPSHQRLLPKRPFSAGHDRNPCGKQGPPSQLDLDEAARSGVVGRGVQLQGRSDIQEISPNAHLHRPSGRPQSARPNAAERSCRLPVRPKSAHQLSASSHACQPRRDPSGSRHPAGLNGCGYADSDQQPPATSRPPGSGLLVTGRGLGTSTTKACFRCEDPSAKATEHRAPVTGPPGSHWQYFQTSAWRRPWSGAASRPGGHRAGAANKKGAMKSLLARDPAGEMHLEFLAPQSFHVPRG
ncbi:unnamed protein product [Ostreobium quekettii]|uniref:Uncharacterized protein n=1 Tax=Ostreobium quekettii TaxID=121088 RepID=A0A8S1IYC7_9CHLO|nr:unnamed protein product [Ostreobium quekettii]